jgi:hypothetical protein
MEYRSNCIITNNQIKDNTVTTTANPIGIASGGLVVHNDAVLTNNTITNNKLGDTINDIVTTTN